MCKRKGREASRHVDSVDAVQVVYTVLRPPLASHTQPLLTVPSLSLAQGKVTTLVGVQADLATREGPRRKGVGGTRVCCVQRSSTSSRTGSWSALPPALQPQQASNRLLCRRLSACSPPHHRSVSASIELTFRLLHRKLGLAGHVTCCNREY